MNFFVNVHFIRLRGAIGTLLHNATLQLLTIQLLETNVHLELKSEPLEMCSIGSLYQQKF